MKKQTQQLVLMLVIGILIGVMGVMAWKSGGPEPTAQELNTTPSGATTTSETTADAMSASSTLIAQNPGLPGAPAIPANMRLGLSVVDQPAGGTVHVTGLSVTETHWIAVYNDEDGKPMWIKGAARVHEGDTEATVELLKPTVAGEKYYAAILSDDGDDTFNRMTDLPPLSPDKVQIVSFLAQ